MFVGSCRWARAREPMISLSPFNQLCDTSPPGEPARASCLSGLFSARLPFRHDPLVCTNRVRGSRTLTSFRTLPLRFVCSCRWARGGAPGEDASHWAVVLSFGPAVHTPARVAQAAVVAARTRAKGGFEPRPACRSTQADQFVRFCRWVRAGEPPDRVSEPGRYLKLVEPKTASGRSVKLPLACRSTT
jgi:hypothetical protein